MTDYHDGFDWVAYHKEIKNKYMGISPKEWWGDDLDVRFLLLKKLQSLESMKVLDVGCNVGITLSVMSSTNELFGFDIEPDFTQKAKGLVPDANICEASITELPYGDNSFDVVVMMNVFPGYEINNPNEEREVFIDKAFREISRVLSTSGKIYITTPNGDSVHYRGMGKVPAANLEEILKCYFKSYKVYGWNTFKPIIPGFLRKHVPKKFWFIPPRYLHKWNFVWKLLVKDMDLGEQPPKFFYIEAQKN